MRSRRQLEPCLPRALQAGSPRHRATALDNALSAHALVCASSGASRGRVPPCSRARIIAVVGANAIGFGGNLELLLRLRLRGQERCGSRRGTRAQERAARTERIIAPSPWLRSGLGPAPGRPAANGASKAGALPPRSSSRPAGSVPTQPTSRRGPGPARQRPRSPARRGADDARTEGLDALRLLLRVRGLGAERRHSPWSGPRTITSPRFVFTRRRSPCCAFSASISTGVGPALFVSPMVSALLAEVGNAPRSSRRGIRELQLHLGEYRRCPWLLLCSTLLMRQPWACRSSSARPRRRRSCVTSKTCADIPRRACRAGRPLFAVGACKGPRRCSRPRCGRICDDVPRISPGSSASVYAISFAPDDLAGDRKFDRRELYKRTPLTRRVRGSPCALPGNQRATAPAP